MDDALEIFSYIIFGLVFILGLLFTIAPRKIWEIFQSWKADDEPSDSYFILQRILGIIMMIIAFAMIVMFVEAFRDNSWFS